MCSAFPTKMGEQMILTSFGDVIISLFMHLGIGYKRKAHKSPGAIVWVSGTEWLGQLLGGHWPSTLAISVPLVEQEYISVELCALFIHLHVIRPVWNILSQYDFCCLLVSWVVCYLYPLKPCIGKGTDHNLL